MGKKSMLLKLMLAVVMFGAATFTASASNGYSKEYNVLAANGSFTIVITGNNVIGRDGPAGYDTGIRFNKGNRLTCISRSGSWYQVVYGNRYLWVSTSYAQPLRNQNATTATTAKNVVITGNNVIGRATPGGRDTGKRFNKGQKLTYHGSNGSWNKVSHGGYYYWVSKQYSYVK